MSSSKDYKRRSIISTISLFVQSGYSALLGLVANLVVTILLSPNVYGIYITVLSMIAFLNYFSDVGLAASLIQKKEITDRDTATTFTFQQALIITLIGIGFLLTPFVISFYRLPVEGQYLYWALLGSFFISSLKTIPSVLLERQMHFKKLVLVQIVENTIFYAVVIGAALGGFGLRSFTYAVVARAIIGVILLYSISFWRIRIGFHLPSFKELIRFGLPYQGVSFLALFKDDLMTLYLGRAIGFEALGYVGWAKKWADAPLRIIMDNISRVAFPLISRFQDQRNKIDSIIKNILSYQTMVIAPIMIGAALTMPSAIDIIPRYAKWEPAVPLFAVFSVSSLIISLGVPYMNLYNAAGRVKVTFTFMAIMTTTIWSVTAFLIPINSLWAFPIAHLITSTSLLFIQIKAKRDFNTNALSHVTPYLLSALLMGLVIWGVQQYVSTTGIINVALNVAVGGATYILLLVGLFKINIVSSLKKLHAI